LRSFAGNEQDSRRRNLFFPQVLRDARRIGEYYPGLSPNSPECMDRLGLSLAYLESKCTNIYDSAEVERVFYPEIEKLLLEFFPAATDTLVYNRDIFDKDYGGDRTEDQDAKNPGVNANYAMLVHNDLNDNSGRVRCRELVTRNLRNFGRTQNYTEEEAGAKMSRRFMSINLAKPIETVEQYPFVLCAWPSFADQPYITNYRIYDDRVDETTRFTYRPEHESPNRRHMRSQCSNAMTLSPTAPSRAGRFIPRASIQRRLRKQNAVRTSWFALSYSSRSRGQGISGGGEGRRGCDEGAATGEMNRHQALLHEWWHGARIRRLDAGKRAAGGMTLSGDVATFLTRPRDMRLPARRIQSGGVFRQQAVPRAWRVRDSVPRYRE
jgi:hypothetical protein